MNKKFVIYLVFITLLSYLSFFWGATGGFIIFSLLVLGLVNYFYYNFYNLFVKNKRYEISNGLLYSSVFAVISIAPFAIGDFSYEIARTYGATAVDMLLPAGVVIYVLSMIICFVVDGYFNSDSKDVKKYRIALGSFLFYFVLYFINVFLSLVIGMMHMLANWS